ncbi:hypothetical protein FIV31_03540 [Coxiella endosymbiont of Ornithodoros amblus]|uniref:hypothetical protein n=1 Tax=Coxiella endosymbiont of Ornithodoros amblus TaxID=1656166 RepID=UPI00244DCA22|nr:hypothetical protein [Coxiella endosymbiont of Ornithodoros amblus]MBW5802649.1 hypothetical protein [Coxiella endosymbiont of Ornithodoros amblus]
MLTKKFVPTFLYLENGLSAEIILKNSYEVFINTPRYTLPIVIVTPGTFSALWRELDLRPILPIKVFGVTGGARSIFLLANIGTLHSIKT